MTSIYNKLKQLQYKEDYPFHMPGHKRNLKIDSLLDAISKIDITEITGFDDLHHPEHDERNTQEVDDGHDKIADREHADVQAGEVQPADDERDERIDDIVDERGDDGRERAADNDADGQVNDVAA